MGWRGAGKLTRNFATVTLIFLLFVAVAVNEQVSAATVSGIVTDSSDSAVPNATFSIRNTATGIAREVTTDALGFYNAPNLPPAIYDVTCSATGFSTQVRSGATLTVGAHGALVPGGGTLDATAFDAR
jgi:hypothetical protein